MKQTLPSARGILAAATLLAAQCAGAAQLVIAQVAPLSGLEAIQGRAYSVGLQLAFNNANKGGGVGGHTFSLVRKDDGGRPEDTITVTNQVLGESKPIALAGYFGNRSIAELVKSGILEKEKIALVGYRTTEIRPDVPYMYSVRAGLRDEISKIAEHLATVGITRLGLFHEDGPGAAALTAAVDEITKKTGSTITARATYPAGTARVSPAIETFLKTPPQAIIMLATGSAAAGFIEQYRLAGGAAQLFAQSGADIEQLAQRLGRGGKPLDEGDHGERLRVGQTDRQPPVPRPGLLQIQGERRGQRQHPHGIGGRSAVDDHVIPVARRRKLGHLVQAQHLLNAGQRRKFFRGNVSHIGFREPGDQYRRHLTPPGLQERQGVERQGVEHDADAVVDGHLCRHPQSGGLDVRAQHVAGGVGLVGRHDQHPLATPRITHRGGRGHRRFAYSTLTDEQTDPGTPSRVRLTQSRLVSSGP